MVGLKINKTLRNVIIAILVVAALVVITSLIPNNDFSEKYEGYDLTTSVGVQSASKTYAEYQLEHKSAKNEILFNINLGSLTNYVYLCTCK